MVRESVLSEKECGSSGGGDLRRPGKCLPTNRPMPTSGGLRLGKKKKEGGGRVPARKPTKARLSGMAKRKCLFIQEGPNGRSTEASSHHRLQGGKKKSILQEKIYGTRNIYGWQKTPALEPAAFKSGRGKVPQMFQASSHLRAAADENGRHRSAVGGST